MPKLPLASLGQEIESLLTTLGEFAIAHGMRAYLVGGPVRDLMLGRKVCDVDVMIQGDALSLAKLIFNEKPFSNWAEVRKPILFKKYFTAKIRFENEICAGVESLDLASARREAYSGIGTSPRCEPGSLHDDLARRDFSINAMALSLSPEDLETLHDHHHGSEDLQDGVLRVLHAKSFEDDPARIIRALRFMKRFHFELEKQTKSAFAIAVDQKYLSKLPQRRAFDELKKVFHEENWSEVLVALHKLDLIQQIDPMLTSGDPAEMRSYIEAKAF